MGASWSSGKKPQTKTKPHQQRDLIIIININNNK